MLVVYEDNVDGSIHIMEESQEKDFLSGGLGCPRGETPSMDDFSRTILKNGYVTIFRPEISTSFEGDHEETDIEETDIEE
jgi:hypothetical protein